jgi:putative transposase
VHSLYKVLGDNVEQRAYSYRQLLEQTALGKEVEQITTATQRGEVFGSEGYHGKVSKQVSRPTRLSSHGGDRKSEDYQNQAG